MKNILRQVMKANKLVERKINPIQEPKIYQKKVVKHDPNDEQHSESHGRTSSRLGFSDIGNTIRRNSFVKRRISVVMDRMEALVSEGTKNNEESDRHAANNPGTTNLSTEIGQSNQTSAGSISKQDTDSTGLDRYSGESSRSSSEIGCLGPSINVSLIIYFLS